MQEISPETLSEQLQNGDEGPLVLDIRHEADFEEWHIPGRINVDIYDELTEDPEQAKEALSNLPAEDQIVTICAAGIVSETATGVLQVVKQRASDIPDHPPNFERVKRANVGQDSIPDDELVELELVPNNCAAE